MIIANLLKQDFHSKYKLHGKGMLFNDIHCLIIHLTDIVNKWSLKNSQFKYELPPEIAVSLLLKFQISLPFVFSAKSDAFLNQISSEFQLADIENEKLRSLIFNYGIKSFIENDSAINSFVYPLN